MRYSLATMAITLLATVGCNGDELKDENARLAAQNAKLRTEQAAWQARATNAESEARDLRRFAAKVRDISLTVTLICTRSGENSAPPATPLLNTVTLRGNERKLDLSSSVSAPPQVVDNGDGVIKVSLSYLPSVGLQGINYVDDLTKFSTLDARFQPVLSGIGLNIVKVDKIELTVNDMRVIMADDIAEPQNGGSGNLIFDLGSYFAVAPNTYSEAIKSWARE